MTYLTTIAFILISASTAIAQTASVNGDAREDFEASGYLGFAVDSFAAEEIQRYLNQDANGKTHERGVFGFDFGYRLFRSERQWPFQLWVYGETVHGARSEDVDCAKNPNFPTCLDAKANLIALGRAIPQNALFMLRNATSLEGFAGIRVEFLPLNPNGTHPAALYLKGQAGFINVSNSDGDAKDVHHWAIGATTVGGPYQGSYLEFGRGRTDLFATNRHKRYKIDGHLERRIRSTPLSFFTQLVADVDMSRGADAIQPYFGITFDLDKLLK
jgi:hypothetical protein